MKTCSYCHSDTEAEKQCDKCGAKLPEKKQEIVRGGPYFERGYILYYLQNSLFSHDETTIQFWLGERLVDTITIPREIIEQFVPEGCDGNDFLFSLLAVSQGEKEVHRVETMNNGRKALFEIKRMDNPEIERRESLSIQELYAELKR